MSDRLYSITKEKFNEKILPIIIRETKINGGRPPKISHYVFFNAILKMLAVSLPWRDCPKEYGNWHTIYTRYKRWCENGLLNTILEELRGDQEIDQKIIFMDSTTVKLHRHGSGALKKKALKI